MFCKIKVTKYGNDVLLELNHLIKNNYI